MSKLSRQLDKLIAAKHALIDAGLSAFESNLIRVQTKLLTEVVTLLGSLPKKNGIVILTPEALQKVLGSVNELTIKLVDAGYEDLIDDFVKQSDAIIASTKKVLGLTGVGMPFTPDDVKVIALIQANISDRFAVIGMDAVETIVTQLKQGVIGNATFKDTVEILTDTIVGTDVRGGLLVRNAKTYAHDSIMELDRGLNLIAGNNFNAEHFYYAGPADKVIRDFCSYYVGKVLTRTEISGLDNGMGLDVWMTGGGWNCRHSWVPVAKEMLDEFEVFGG